LAADMGSFYHQHTLSSELTFGGSNWAAGGDMMDADYHQLALLIGTYSLSHLGFRSVGLDRGFDFF